jgi:hypothetical protein
MKVHEEKGETPEGKVVSFMTSFEAVLTIPEEKQSEFVNGVFTDVFRLTKYELNIIEN